MSKQLYFIQESFTDQELEILNKYFTNTDKPVFGLINLPDVVKERFSLDIVDLINH